MKVLAQKKYQDHIPCSFPYNLVCVDDNFSEPTDFYRVVKMVLINLLKSMNTVKL